jgi:hypothetical protein
MKNHEQGLVTLFRFQWLKQIVPVGGGLLMIILVGSGILQALYLSDYKMTFIHSGKCPEE